MRRSWRIGTGTARFPPSARRRATRPSFRKSSSPGARVVFGTLVAVGKPPEGLEEMLIWITDESYELEA